MALSITLTAADGATKLVVLADPVIVSAPVSSAGLVTSFTTTPGSFLNVDSDKYWVETAGRSYSLTNPDPQRLRFEIRAGDHAWFDSVGSVDRAEIDGSAGQLIPTRTPVNINYQFMVEANGANGSFTNSARWLVTAEMHNDDPALGSTVHTSPPFAIQLSGDHLQVVAGYVLSGGNPANGSPDLHYSTLWTDPNPIRPGVFYDISLQANFSNSGGGYLKVAINGTQVVNYQGPLGYGAGTYWMYGLYRNSGPTETVVASFRNMSQKIG